MSQNELEEEEVVRRLVSHPGLHDVRIELRIVPLRHCAVKQVPDLREVVEVHYGLDVENDLENVGINVPILCQFGSEIALQFKSK